jgi:N-acetylmuramoyl-L-alanine amidase
MLLHNSVRTKCLRYAVCVVLGGVCALMWGASPAATRGSNTRKPAKTSVRKVKLPPWELAEHGRETLEAIPEGSRTKANYATALDSFRALYHAAPQDVHAPNAVFAVAELLADQGRTLHDAKSLKAAVGQYEFMRIQYPGSSLRVAALLAQGQIYANDIHDSASARERYSLLLKQFPNSERAEEARAGLDALTIKDSSASKDQRAVSARRNSPGRNDQANTVQPLERSGGLPPTPVTSGEIAPGRAGNAVASNPAATYRSATDRSGTTRPTEDDSDRQSAPTDTGSARTQASSAPVPGPSRVAVRSSGKMSQVTGIRHWSTPTYTRVAIDLGDDVTFEAARVPNPDRIYFDLHGTQLARELVGKSFAVTDDGFLKKIRAAQFSNDMTRVVLDVNDVTEYSAFLLPNPYRLIIDIHGVSKGTPGPPPDFVAAVPSAGRDSFQAPLSAQIAGPRTAPVIRPTQSKPVPNTISSSVRRTNTTDIAALSAEPGKVEATSVPISQPIAAVVRGNSPDRTVATPTDNSNAISILGTSNPIYSSTNSSSSPTTSLTKKGRKNKSAPGSSAEPARAAVPTADGQTSLVRALGLKIGRIVIDAGHGGHDSGTIGADGIQEKDVVLDVALRLGKALHERLGAEIIYTRSDDTFIPLETRTAIANKAQADLFLSIHANSSSDSSARGVETYYLNFTSSPDALETAARENAVSDQSIHQLSELVKKITLKDKISESREFAGDVEASLYGGLQRGNAGLKDRGVKKAPFVVLIGANMPSILAEISFVTNPKDADQLRQPDYRQRVAESLYKGVAKYAGGLGGVKGTTERASIK